jgi:hypothetical protein
MIEQVFRRLGAIFSGVNAPETVAPDFSRLFPPILATLCRLPPFGNFPETRF